RTGVDEEPGRAVHVAVELEEVVPSPERAEVTRQEPLALVIERASRKRCIDEQRRRGSAAVTVDCVTNWDGSGPAVEHALQFAPAEGLRGKVELYGHHTAPEVAAQRRGHQHAIRSEDSTHGDAVGDVEVRHGRHVPNDVRLRSDALKLL
ncbi:MAG TPA: hypothetical protein VMT97_15970, partial [Terriglobales bacterium]|nr:hypothetical protein [Terriglobales bacterium]